MHVANSTGVNSLGTPSHPWVQLCQSQMRLWGECSLARTAAFSEVFPKFSGQSQRMAGPVHLLGRGGAVVVVVRTLLSA